jgi:uncharacterized protein (TIGR02145 family)
MLIMVLTMAFTFSCSSDDEGEDSIKDSFIDPRDNQKYNTVEIGNQTWMAGNLNYNTNGSKCYDNNSSICTRYGRLYDWATAMVACPNGWHLPTNGEWDALYRFADNTYIPDYISKDNGYSLTAGGKLKTRVGWSDDGNGTDDFGFAALPGGAGDNFEFYDIGDYGVWWSSTNEHEHIEDDERAYIRFISYEEDYAFWNTEDKNDLLSVRCIQN